MKTTLLTTLVLASGITSVAATEVGETQRSAGEKTGLNILSGTAELPFAGHWILSPPRSSGNELLDCTLVPPPAVLRALQGQRQGLMEEHRQVQRSAYPLRQLYWDCFQYAQQHDGHAPPNLDALDDIKRGERSYDHTPSLHYVPDVVLLTDPEDRRSRPADTVVLAFETQPLINDGKHWVLLSDGRTQRREIDRELFAQHGATLVPGREPLSAMQEPDPEQATYRVLARVAGASSGPVNLTASNRITGATLDLTWDIANPATGKPEAIQTWAQQKLGYLAYMCGQAQTPILQHWLARATDLYGTDPKTLSWETSRRGNRRRGQQTSTFGVLGGRAAIRETLQLQNLRETDAESSNTVSVAIDTIPGVEVKSHPFAEMLAGKPGGRLELARVAPPDQFFAYFAQPKGMLQLLDGGSEFLFHAGSMATRRSVSYGLKERYLTRLGLSETWTRAFLSGGAVEELAVMLPDLFLIDGTDMTVVAKLKNPLLASGALALVGMRNLSDRTVVKNADGEPVYWARRDDLLFISTHEAHLDRVLTLRASGGVESLGASAEFRYMLTQLPVEASTTTLVYFSDPFIRRLVGPATKIGQLRRLHARAELEALSAGALLYRADGHDAPLNFADLLQRGYIDAPSRVTDARFEPDGTAVSERFGRAASMHSLSARPVTDVTPAEAKAYQAYRDNYTRFWRRFFDPIAIRINQPAEQTFELSTFILPLIDNSIYQGLREVLNPMESGLPLVVPRIEPAPVSMLSFNIHEKAWVGSLDDMSDMVNKMFGLNGRILDYLGPDVHVAVMDDDPIVSFGSGELAGTFGGAFGDGEEMVLFSLLGSVLTRPSQVLIGLNDPEAALNFLRTTPLPRAHTMTERWMEAGMYRVTGEDRWIYRLSLIGVVQLRFGIEVQDRYLVIRNLPLTTETTVSAGVPAEHSGAQLLLHPAACEQQLAGLFASAHENQGIAALEGISFLLPLMWAGAPSIEAAQQQHARLFGFAPVHPTPGAWSWDGAYLASTIYGDPAHQQQPAYQPGERNFGMLRRVEDLRLSMQLEQDGLRTTARWSLRGALHPGKGVAVFQD